MPVTIVCDACGHVLYVGDIIPAELRMSHFDHRVCRPVRFELQVPVACPKCGRPLSKVPIRVLVQGREVT
jgi:hypothetical protein